jgi:hypothetical protein
LPRSGPHVGKGSLSRRGGICHLRAQPAPVAQAVDATLAPGFAGCTRWGSSSSTSPARVSTPTRR